MESTTKWVSRFRSGSSFFLPNPFIVTGARTGQEILLSGLVNKALLPFVFANIGIQFIIQPILHYWQPHFQRLDQTVNSQTLGLIFSCYCGTSAAAGYLFSRFSFGTLLRSRYTLWVLFLGFATAYIAFGFVKGIAAALVTFCLLQGLLSVTRTSLGIRMNQNIPNESRASILSSLSLVSRLGSVSALAFVAGFAAPEGMMQFMSVTSLVVTLGVLMTASLMKVARI